MVPSSICTLNICEGCSRLTQFIELKVWTGEAEMREELLQEGEK